MQRLTGQDSLLSSETDKHLGITSKVLDKVLVKWANPGQEKELSCQAEQAEFYLWVIKNH